MDFKMDIERATTRTKPKDISKTTNRKWDLLDLALQSDKMLSGFPKVYLKMLFFAKE